jgi:hypothetical protein
MRKFIDIRSIILSTIKPKGGWNNRLHSHDIGKNQWALMQNVDMTHDEHFTQIKGSMRYHGSKFTKDTIPGTNKLTNGSFETWTGLTDLLTNGNMETASPPSSWTPYGAGATWARESTIIKEGTYSGKLTRAGTNCGVTQTIATGVTTKTYIFSAWVYQTAGAGNRANIYVAFGAASGQAFHSGAATRWEFLSVSVTNPSAASGTAYLINANADGDVYFDSVKVYEQLAPTGWTLSGAGATVAREEGTIKVGSYSAKLTRNGANAVLQQTISDKDYTGRTVTFGAWVYSTTLNSSRVTDGTNASAYHGGTGWEYLTVTFTSGVAAPSINMVLYINGSAYFDEASVTEDSQSQSTGVTAASCIALCYNQELDTADILATVGGEIYKKNLGANEFESLYSGITPNAIRFTLNQNNKQYIPDPKFGLFEYDGISKVIKVDDILLKDIIMSKETNKAFGVRADNQLAYNWTDDLVETEGVPIKWNPLNTDTVPSVEGDSIEKIMFMSGRLVFFMTNGIWIEYVNGGPENWRYEKIRTTVGCIAPKTVKYVKDEIWFVGNSPTSGVGLYAFNGSAVKLISYDVENIFKRINPNMITEACGEFVDNIYKLSFALDASIANNCTIHVDAVNYNSETELPNFYGPHTYGFHASSVLNTKRFPAKHIFSSLHDTGSYIYAAGDYLTQYAVSPSTPGDLIQTILLSPIISEEETKDGKLDATWMKRYGPFYPKFPPQGNWSALIEILRDFKNETYLSWNQWMDGGNYKLDALMIGSDPFDPEESSVQPVLQDILSNAIQIQITNSTTNTKFILDEISYDFRPVRRIKQIQRVRV